MTDKLSASTEQCKCGKHVLERWCGTYSDEWGRHRREICEPDAPRRNDRLSELERLHAAATETPWYVVGHPWNPDGPAYIIAGNSDPHVGRAVCDFGIQRDEETGEADTMDNGYADADYIEAAANFAPVAIRVIRRLIEALERTPQGCLVDEPPPDDCQCWGCRRAAALSEVKKELGL